MRLLYENPMQNDISQGYINRKSLQGSTGIGIDNGRENRDVRPSSKIDMRS